VRLVRLLAVALATGCFVVTGELWSSALNPSPTIVFPTPVQPPPRLLPGDLSRHGPPAIVRLKPVPTYPLPHATAQRHGHGKPAARHGGTTHRRGRTFVVAQQQTAAAAPAPAREPSPQPAPASAPAPAPPPKPAPKPPSPPTPPPAPPTPAPTPPPAPAPTPSPPSPAPAPPQSQPSVEAAPPVQTPPPVTTPAAPPPAAPPPTSTPVPPTPPTPPTPPPTSDTRPGHGYGDENHQHTGPPGQTGP
jgi:hypothetical protein